MRVALPAAMRDEAVARVFGALAAVGAPARFVGGCVRDALLRRPAGDVDIATPLPPDRVSEALVRAGLKAVPTGIEHGTVTAVVPVGEQHRTFEITTLRIDVETDGRHAVVAFTDDWRADAARRDFTMNALSAEADGLLHDYFGGAADALAGRVRFVGDPGRRLEEDVLRLLRFFRFQAHYGREPAAEGALLACRAYAPALEALAGERVRVELLKLLAAPDPVGVWRSMQTWEVAPHVLAGRVGDAVRLAGLVAVEPAPDPLRRLAALWDGGAAAADALADRLRLSNDDRERLAVLARHREAVVGDCERRALRRLLHRVGRARGVDLALLGWAAAPEDLRFRALLEEAEAWPDPAFPLKGRDVLDLGVAPGRQVGRLLEAAERWWIDADFAPDRSACLTELRRLAAAGADDERSDLR